MTTGVILYGPPASGKDTVTAELLKLRAEYVAYKRLKVGSGNQSGYRYISTEELEDLDTSGGILYRNRRYGNEYVTDRVSLEALFAAGRTPILHVGQVAGISATTACPATWWRVLLWCTRATTELRAHGRGNTDVGDRLTAWDETLEDLAANPSAEFDLVLHTDTLNPEDAANTIDRLTIGSSPPSRVGNILSSL